jgi:hypothetical protein
MLDNLLLNNFIVRKPACGYEWAQTSVAIWSFGMSTRPD